MNYYNDNEPFVCDWLENLISAGHLPPGDVDRRSITDIEPRDLAGYTQCHFFCGIGGWPLALLIAGWPTDRHVWTGSCPCQPLSGAGKRKGHADERHLWPAFHNLIAKCSPPVVFGEQVASKDGREWLAAVRLDLEALGYACGAADLCAAGVGAPHIRQRLWWVADAQRERRPKGQSEQSGSREGISEGWTAGCSDDSTDGWLADADDAGPQGRIERGNGSGQCAAGQGGMGGRLADAECDGQYRGRSVGAAGWSEFADSSNGDRRSSPPDSFWRDSDWLYCTDGKWRPVESGTFPLASGIPGRVGQLRAYGNAIVPQLAAEFVRAFME